MKTNTYVYETKWFPGETRVSLDDDKKTMGLEWQRVWADVTEAGTFVVYRKSVWNTLDGYPPHSDKVAWVKHYYFAHPGSTLKESVDAWNNF